jgi:multisubunit Na+/H+ antiporter MnhB subunit
VAIFLQGALVAALLPLALWTLVRARGLAAVAGFAGCGLLLALAWLTLGAPLVALAQAIGTTVAALLLARAAGRLGTDDLADPADRPVPALRVAIALLCATVALALAVVMPDGPAPGAGESLADMLFGTRLLDTLVALALLPVAGIGLWSLARGGPGDAPP